MGIGQDYRQSDEQLIQAELAKIIKVKDGKLYLGKKQIKITLPGKPGKNIKGDKGEVAEHEWDGTRLRFRNPDKTWGQWTDLRGRKGEGKPGYTPVKDKDYFDGKPGYTPVKDKDYRDGKDARPPKHEWEGNRLRFQNPDGSWGQWIDLRGKPGEKIKGDTGGVPEHEWRGTLLRIMNPDGTWSKWADLKGMPGKGIRGKKGDKPVEGVDYKKPIDGKDAELPEAENILILKEIHLVVGETGKAALEKQFQNIRVLKV